jgi:hypothetical protein
MLGCRNSLRAESSVNIVVGMFVPIIAKI